MSRLRSSLYAAARALGDVEAARRGPVSLGRRLARRRVYAGWIRVLERALRGRL